MVSKEYFSEEVTFNLRPEGGKEVGSGLTRGQAIAWAEGVQRPGGSKSMCV